MDKERDQLLDHDFDGIKEFDNPMPPWWLNLFYITVFWGIIYLIYYHVIEIGDRAVDEYKREYDPQWNKAKDPSYEPVTLLPSYQKPYYLLAAQDITPRMRLLAEGGGKITAKTAIKVLKTYEALTDAPGLATGKNIFIKNCVACHGQLGGGGIGPNLTDDYWIHGAGIDNIGNTIFYGVTSKGMLAWGPILKEKEIQQVASYVLTLKGSNPPNPKAPQGILVQQK
jgi:cytochrome c oxidase cbb3-type subunit III